MKKEEILKAIKKYGHHSKKCKKGTLDYANCTKTGDTNDADAFYECTCGFDALCDKLKMPRKLRKIEFEID